MKKLALGLAALLALPTGANAAAFINGGFELGTNPGTFSTVNAGDTDITGWTITAGSVDYIGSYWVAGEGSRSIDLNGNAIGAIAQTFDTVAGTTYIVNFLLSGNPDGAPDPKTLDVSATGAATVGYSFPMAGVSRPNNMLWTPMQYVFTATGASTTLSFASTTPGGFYGPALDGVSVVAVPEPATWAMMIGGLAIVGVSMRRRKTAVSFA